MRCFLIQDKSFSKTGSVYEQKLFIHLFICWWSAFYSVRLVFVVSNASYIKKHYYFSLGRSFCSYNERNNQMSLNQRENIIYLCFRSGQECGIECPSACLARMASIKIFHCEYGWTHVNVNTIAVFEKKRKNKEKKKELCVLNGLQLSWAKLNGLMKKKRKIIHSYFKTRSKNWNIKTIYNSTDFPFIINSNVWWFFIYMLTIRITHFDNLSIHIENINRNGIWIFERRNMYLIFFGIFGNATEYLNERRNRKHDSDSNVNTLTHFNVQCSCMNIKCYFYCRVFFSHNYIQNNIHIEIYSFIYAVAAYPLARNQESLCWYVYMWV